MTATLVQPVFTVDENGDAVEAEVDFEEVMRCIPGYDPWDTAEDCWFDAEEAASAINFFALRLQHVKGKEFAGNAFLLRPWQMAIVGNLYGWKRPDGTRRYRQVLVYIPRKNSKTTMCAGLALRSFFCDGEPGGEIYTSAAEREQASVLFNIARTMVQRDDVLSDGCEVYKFSMVIPTLAASFKPVSSESGTKHGYNPSFVCIDELHAQKSGDLVEAFSTGIGSRSDPIIAYLTTADYERESICNHIHSRASKIRDGDLVDKSFLPVIYEAQKKDDWKDPAIWKMANPNFGVSVLPSFIEESCNEAKQSPYKVNSFRRWHLNILTETSAQFFDMERWRACRLTFDPKKVRKVPCVGALDLATKRDFVAFVLYFPSIHAVLPFFWIPQSRLEDPANPNREDYRRWAEAGLCEVMPGEVVDFSEIEAKVLALRKEYRPTQIAYDPRYCEQFAQRIATKGVRVVEYVQNFGTMSEPMEECSNLVMEGRLRHNGHEILTWMASNTEAVEQKSTGMIRAGKSKEHKKIDGIVALIMAIGRVMREPPRKSVYSTRGFRRL